MSRRGKTGTIAFRPRARLLKLIGEELISDDVVAVSEIVKNAHDADALMITLSFRAVTGDDGEITIRDDGSGMDLDTLLGRWMEPAASTKVRADRKITPRGRRVLGEKGVGRFAADKLARHLEIVSRCPESDEELRAVIDWDRFDDGDRMLAEVENRWEVGPAREIAQHGMLLKLTGLRTRWTERMFRRLSLRLGRLLSPFRERDQFTIRIESNEFPAYSGDLRSDILDHSPYRIEASFDGDQTITLDTPRIRSAQQRWNGHGELSCGPVRIRLFAFDLEGEALARIGPRMEVRAWLKEWTGVSVYRDGFRVWPYGEPHDDWLRLDQRRVNNPVEHLSNNQVIGFIDISRDGNPGLLDQTNREGLINNQALEDLRRLVYVVLQVLEAERQSIRHPAARGVSAHAGNAAGEADSFGSELERIAEKASPALAADLRRLAVRLEEQRARDQAAQTRLVDGYAGLAAIGQMATSLFPVVPQELSRMEADLRGLQRSSAGANGHVGLLQRIVDSLDVLTDHLQFLQFAAGDRDRRRALDLVKEIEEFAQITQPLLARHDVRMEVDCPASEVVRTEMRPEHFHCLLQILTANALDWIGRAETRRIRIALTADDEDCEIVFSDTGPGIHPQITTQVFEPQFSLKEDGRGMGLTIARRLVESHGGRIHVIVDGRRRGANIAITLPRKRSRATFHNGR